MSVKNIGNAYIAQEKPYYAKLKKGKLYLWCRCGLSKTQPFCDGESHQTTSFKPLRYVSQTENEEVLFCGCKQTQTPPFCDGTHNNLSDEYASDDPLSVENRRVKVVTANKDGVADLNGGCYVATLANIPLKQYGALKIGTLISEDTGAVHQSQFYIEVSQGQSPALSFADRHVIIFVKHGEGKISIAGKDFSISAQMGVYIRPHEAFSFNNPAATAITLFASVCPAAAGPEIQKSTAPNFDESYPCRTVATNNDKRNQMANRFWQLLVDKTLGCDKATQFIGEIPQSKAIAHRHLYEESLIVLKGSGYMWTEDYKAPVNAGDIIFLPRKQLHSLQCTDPNGLYLVGVIYPGDNPSINY